MSPQHNAKLDHAAQDRVRVREREKGRKGMYILFSLEAFPPEIFCTRNWPSSVFSSRSCFWRSSFDLPHNWTVLILVAFDCHPPTRQPMCFSTRVFHSFYHLVRGLYADFAQVLCCRSLLCGLACRARKILGCAAVSALMVVKR